MGTEIETGKSSGMENITMTSMATRDKTWNGNWGMNLSQRWSQIAERVPGLNR